MFIESSSGKYNPRSLFIDTEPSVIDEMKSNEKKKFYNPNQMISFKTETGNLFSRGYRGLEY